MIASSKVSISANDEFSLAKYHVSIMEKIGSSRALRWYLSEWRDKVGLTQDAIAARMDTNKGQISKLETGKQRLNDRWIMGYAYALGIEAADLLHHPDKPSVQTLLKGASPEVREQASRVVEAFLKAI